jgi:hypothetical protein
VQLGARSRIRLTLAPVAGEGRDSGLRPTPQQGFQWGLNAWQAERIAERIDRLTAADCKSGSDIIELGIEGELPVKISHGEFTDDFLVRTF